METISKFASAVLHANLRIFEHGPVITAEIVLISANSFFFLQINTA